MNDKKNIDRLFREKFKDFEVAPPEFVWENIEEKLREKKKRRVIPLWIRLAGAAAVLVVGTFFMSPYYSGIDTNDNPVVIEKDAPKRITPTNRPIPNNGIIIVDSTKINGDNSAVASGDENTHTTGKTTTDKGTDKVNGSDEGSTAFDRNRNAVAHEGKAGQTPSADPRDARNGSRKNRHRTPGHTTQAVAHQNNSDKNKAGTTTSGSNTTPATTTGTGAAQGLPGKNQSDNAVAAGSEKNPQQAGSQDRTVPDNAYNIGQKTDIIKKDIPAEQAIAETPVDTALVSQPENPLEKLLQDKLNGNKEEDKAVAEISDKGKWNIKPQVAPVFYNSLSGGSPIDGQFAGNSKSFDNDLSYGVGIDYAVTDRLSVRSGINSVNLSYATNDVQFRASLSGQTNNVSARAKTANIVVSTEQNQPGNIPGDIGNFTTLSVGEQAFNGSMIQTTGYIEVPVEMSYALVNRKFGIDVIGGVSTLFLNENNVSVVSSQGYSTEVGEAQNLNSVHFSTNIGVGFKYRFWKSFQANFEPTFKYQVNAYSRDAGNFKPYFIGLYSGISFSF